MESYLSYVQEVTQGLLLIDSPSGFTEQVMHYVQQQCAALGYTLERDRKGNGLITVQGKSERQLGICAHVDTLGLMVRAIQSDGTLAVTRIGGPLMPTLDGEYCRIRTRDGRCYTGTILCDVPAAHVYSDAATKPRDEKAMIIRIDEIVKEKKDVEALGIQVGDYICIDTKTVWTPSGFIKSRFLDDKLSVGILLATLKHWHDEGLQPKRTVRILISTYEEVGHGMAHVPPEIEELIAVDMGCIGDNLTCTEYDVSICAKDSTGPYDYAITSRLIELAKKHQLQYAVDIYPHYGSDVSACLSGGNDLRGALIGPGVHASHGMERSHIQAVDHTIQLLTLYCCDATA